ncbi:hypothetical protein CBR_g42108 [Chara braunii]|uniref:Uncharacterized protein n=1 Tax=Chara braunii TaxID=69332 RepID=A0A388LX30_CHABU|nr:hypothetical protein CBR_g42108 [Chara braunii]|eukprot:GBG86825.1 hypothetical protein CBR_g42108 [Chara braunii]
MERNPSRLLGLLENFCKAGQTVFFFGKAHASVVWGLLRTGRNVVTLEKEARMIDYVHEFVKTHVADTRNAFEFVRTTDERNWDPKRDMYWKLPGNKRTDVWDFLFGPGPPGPTDLEYSRRRNLVFAVLNGYPGAPRESVSHFLRRLDNVYFTLAEPLTLENYKSQLDEEDPFNAEDMEELSDSETFDFESMPLPRVVGQRMPQPPPSGQHPGRGGGGDEGDGAGGGGDGSQFAGKGTGETSSVEKASDGKGSGGKGSGGKGSGGKGSGGKRRTSGSPQYMETDPHCVGSRDFDMRDEATLTSDQVRVDSQLSARSLFPIAQERSLVLNTLLLKEGASSFCLEGGMPALQRSEDWRFCDVLEGPAPGVLETGSSENERHTPGEDERSLGTRAVHQEEETQRWQSRKVLETGGSECERHTSEGASVDTDSESAGARGETHAVQRGEETRHGPAREDVKWLHARALVIGTSEEVLHSRSAVATTREGVLKGGQWTSVQAPVLDDDEDEEEPVVEAHVHGDEKGGEPVVEGSEVTVDIRTDPQRKYGDSLPTRCGEEQGGRASVMSTARGMVLREAIEVGDDSAATELVSDSGVTEMQNVESSVEGGEVAVCIKMDPERKDHDSPSTRCGADQGDRASVLNTGREMVVHEAIDLPSHSTAIELVSDTAVTEVQNLESSVDVGAVARQEGEFPQRAPEHGKICE